MEDFIKIIVSNKTTQSEVIQQFHTKNINNIGNLIVLLEQQFNLKSEEKELIDLYKHIQCTYCYSEQKKTQIFYNLKKMLGVLNIEDFKSIDKDDAKACGIVDELDVDDLTYILQKEMRMNEEDIPKVIQNLKENGINLYSNLQELEGKQAMSFGIPKLQFQKWKDKYPNTSSQDNERKKILESFYQRCEQIKQIKENGKLLTVYKYPRYKETQFKDISELKTIIFIGETGVGKSTLINFFCNYYIGVQFEDPFRFEIVDENGKEFSTEVAVSKTKDVIDYYLKWNEKPGLRIIDTPGFGDTRGFEYDEKISDLIGSKLKQLDELTLICFVMKSSVNRLTVPQNYVINGLLKLFGKDVVKNFLFLFTFADFSQPLALKALTFQGDQQTQKCPVADLIRLTTDPFWIKFNNAAFQSFGEDSKKLWKEAYEQFKLFDLEKIQKTSFISLKLTKDVIFERKQLQNIVIQLRPDVQQQLHLQAEIEEIIQMIEKLSKEQFESNDFAFHSKRHDIVKVYLKPNEYVTNCISCNRTCHYPCGIPDSDDKKYCCAMNDGKCTICEGKCPWENHKNMNFRFETEEKITIIKLEDLKAKVKKQQKLTKEDLKEELNKNLQNAKQKCSQQISKLMQCVNKLNKIALQPAISQSESDYIVYLIADEEYNKKKGYEQRITSLMNIKKEWDWIKEQSQK